MVQKVISNQIIITKYAVALAFFNRGCVQLVLTDCSCNIVRTKLIESDCVAYRIE